MAVYPVAAGAFLVYLAMTFFVSRWLNLSGMGFYIFFGLMSALGLTGAGLWIYFKTKWKGGGGAAGGGPVTQDAAIDQIVREADQRLASQNVTIANLPLVFVVGDRGSTKTSAMVYSGVEPELLAGAAFGEGNMIVPTAHANVWFARGTAFVEAAGAVFADPQKWLSLVRRLKPASLKSLVGKGQQAPRGVLLCFDVEAFAKPGASDSIAAAARYIQARFSEISQTLGINFPVYVLFTRADRVQFFTDYVRQLSNEEATQVFGATLPIRDSSQGVYAEEESRRLTEAFNGLFHSLADKRTIFLPREGDPAKTPQPYEFPREFAKLRGSIVNFLVEVCRPSQLRASPFLRGFYFAGVRPIVVNDSAPISMKADGGEDALRGAGAATQMFRLGKLQEEMQKQAQAKASTPGRRVPQWMFLGHLFNDVLLKDTSALGASGSSTKTSGAQRWLLGIASALLLLFSIGLLVSFFGNKGLEDNAIVAAKDLAPQAELVGCAAPSLAQLQKLDTLRQSLLQLTEYEDKGAPIRYRLGLYAGNDMLPEVRKAYYDRFRALLFGPTQKGLIAFMGSRPDQPNPQQDNFLDAYDTVKSYLLTAEEYKRATTDKSLADFLGTTLHQRWSSCKEPPSKELSDLAEKQFKFYAGDLVHGNPYPGPNDKSVDKGQLYLSKFGGVQTAYAALLGEANKKKAPQSYNERFAGTDYAVVDRVPVAYAFTKDGYAYMNKLIKENKFSGEAWVLGRYASASKPTDDLAQGIRDAYNTDYISTWRKVVREARFTGYAGLPDAKDKLQRIIGTPQPIVCMLWWTAQNTNIDLGSVKQAFAAVHFVAPPTDSEPCVTQKTQPYNDALKGLQESIDRAVQPGVDPMSQASSINSQKNSAKNTAISVSSGPDDAEGKLNSTVTNLMLQPILGVPTPDPGAGANAAGAAFCNGFNGLKNKFPFRQVEPEVSLQELAEIFKPQSGKLWQFYEQTGKQFITCSAAACVASPDAKMPVNPAFVDSFTKLVRFSKALYGDNGAEPNYKYILKPRSEFYDTYTITVNGEKSTIKAGAQSKTYSWPGPGSPSFALEIVQKGNTNGVEVQRFSTLWSVFRFFANAEKTDGTNFTFFNRSGRDLQPAKIDGKVASYDFSLDTQGAPAVFSKDFLASLNCIGKVANSK